MSLCACPQGPCVCDSQDLCHCPHSTQNNFCCAVFFVSIVCGHFCLNKSNAPPFGVFFADGVWKLCRVVSSIGFVFTGICQHELPVQLVFIVLQASGYKCRGLFEILNHRFRKCHSSIFILETRAATNVYFQCRFICQLFSRLVVWSIKWRKMPISVSQRPR